MLLLLVGRLGFVFHFEPENLSALLLNYWNVLGEPGHVASGQVLGHHG